MSSRARRSAALALAVLTVVAGLPIGALALPTPPPAGTDTGSPAVTATAASGTVDVSLRPADASVQAGNRTTFEVVVDGFSDGIGAYEVIVNTSDAGVAPVVDATKQVSGRLSIDPSIADDGSGARLRALQTDTAETGPLVLGNVTFRGEVAGTVDLNITTAIVGDESDQRYPIDDRRNATLAVDPRPGSLALSANRSTADRGDTVRFEVTGSTGSSPIRYEWDLDGDDNYERTTSVATVDYVYESIPGVAWSPSVRVTDDAGTTVTAGTTLLSGNEPPVASAGVNRTVVSTGGSTGVAFDASGSSDPDGSIASYAWDFGADGTVDATGKQAVGSFPPRDQRRNVPVVLTVTDGQGATDTVQLLVTVAADANQPPVAAFSQSPSRPSPGENVTLNAAASSDPDGSIASYAWDLDDDGSTEASGRTVVENVSRIAASVTLTVTDDDGATDTASRAIETGVATINVTGTVTVPGGGLLYLNDPPNASFRASPANADAGDEVRFTSTSFDADGNVTRWAWYVDGSAVSDERERCPPDPNDPCIVEPDLRPEDVSVTFDTAGTYNVTLVVTDDDNATDRATRAFTVEEEGADDPTAAFTVGEFFVPNLTTGPVLLGGAENGTGAETQATGLFTIEAGDDVEFDASASSAIGDRSITRYYWTLDQKNGSEFKVLYGEKVTDAFPAKGEYEVTLEVTDSTGETDQATQNVSVAERNETPEVTEVSADREGATLEGVSLTNTYSVEVANADPIDRVEFELAGRETTDTTGGDGWSGQFELGRLDDDATLTVTVYDEDGDSDRVTRSVDVVQTPGWVEALIRTGSVEVRENSPTEIVITKRIPEESIDVEIDLPAAGIEVLKRWGNLRFRAGSGIQLVYEMRTQTVSVDGDGSFVAELGPLTTRRGIEAKGTIGIDGNENWQLRNLRVTAAITQGNWIRTVEASVSHNFEDVPVKVKASAEATLVLGRDLGVTVRLGQRGGNLALTGGQIAVGLRADGSSGSASGEVCWVGVTCAGGTVSAYFEEARLTGALQLETDPFRLNPALQFGSGVQVSASIGPFDPSTTFSFGGSIGSAPIRLLSVEGTGDPLAATPTRLEGSGGPGRAGTFDLDARAQSTATGLTDDGVRDGPPAVAAGKGTYTAVWAREDPDGESGETDIYATTSADGTTWTGATPIADGTRIAYDPDVTADGDRRAAVWMRTPFPTNDSTVAEIRSNTSIALAVDNGDGWSSPMTIQDGNESAPTIAAAGDRVLVAWVRDGDGNVTTTADRDVRFAIYDAAAGSLGAPRTIPNATAVDVAGGPNGFTLAYLESEDGANGSVVRAGLTNGALVEAARHPATEVQTVTAGPRAIAWTEFGDNGTVLRHAPAGGPTTRVPTTGVLNVGSPTLLADAGDPVVVYAGGQLAPNASRAVFVQRRADGKWLPARPLTPTTGSVDRRLGRAGSGAAIADGGLVATATTENRTTDRPADVVAVRLELAPDLTVSARTDADLENASVGDRVTVNYTVRNVGDRPVTERTTVAVETPSGTVATRTVGVLAVGDRANGSVAAQVPESGRLTVRTDAGDAVDEGDESNNAARLVTARPDLSVSAADVTRERRGEDLLVTADVRNSGPVPVANATVRLRSGNRTVAEERVDVPDNGRRTARLRVPIAAINRSVGDAVVVDPAGAVTESDETNNAAGVRLLAVDLGLRDAVGTTDAPGGVLADGYVSSAGPVDATAEVTVDANGTALTYRVPVEAPDTAGGESFERVRLYHPTTNGTLDVSVTPRVGRDADGFDNAVRTAVNASGGETDIAPVRVTGVNATNVGGTATIAVDLAAAGNVTTGVPLRVSVDGTTVAERTAVVAGGDERTVTLNASVQGATQLTVAAPGSTATGEVEAVAPDVNGNGAPATDPDGDGEFEDVDGNGEFTVVDVAVLLEWFDRSAVQQNAALFDFDGSGDVNIVDVAELLDET